MTSVKLELLGNTVGNFAQIVKYRSVNFFERVPSEVKRNFPCCWPKSPFVNRNTNSINSILAFRAPMVDTRKDDRRRQADNPGERKDERGGLQTPPGRGQRTMAGGRHQQLWHLAWTRPHCCQGYTR